MPKSLLAVAAIIAVLAAVVFLYKRPATKPTPLPAPITKSTAYEDPEIVRLKHAANEEPVADPAGDGIDAPPAQGYESPGAIAKKRAQAKRKVVARTATPGAPAPEEFEVVEVDEPPPVEPPKLQPVVSEKAAREALNLVGVDPAAEIVWMTAINDPNLSRRDRKNLIEDLNENGFVDPKRITLDELPLVEARLGLIEDLAPDAMDDANLAAFQEAYKDLLNIYAKLTHQIENAER